MTRIRLLLSFSMFSMSLMACSSSTTDTSCTVTDNTDGTATISCPDGSSAVVGDGCDVADNGDGTATLTCSDGTSVTVVIVGGGRTGDSGPRGDAAGGDTAGGDTAGGDTAGGDTAGGDTAGGDANVGDSTGGDDEPIVPPPECSATNPCASPAECIGGGCVAPVSDLPGYVSQMATRATSWVGAVQLPGLFDTPELCCFDFNGDGQPDDAYGSLMGLTASIPGAPDPQQALDDAVTAGELAMVFDWRVLPVPPSTGSVQFSIFDAAFSGTASFPQRLTGTGNVTINPGSFGTHGALAQFNHGQLTGQSLRATDGLFALPMNFFGILANLPFRSAILEVDLTSDAGGCSGICSVDVTGAGPPNPRGGARLGGILAADDLVEVFDTGFRTCSCAGIDPTQQMVSGTPDARSGTYQIQCEQPVGDTSSCIDAPCDVLEVVCGTIGFFGTIMDFDTNNDGVNDGLTAGFRLRLSGVTVDGLTP